MQSVGESNPLRLEYHDRVWAVPIHHDVKHFEFLVLDVAPSRPELAQGILPL
jgi:3-methyladenine DNA glycosylase Tag